MLYDGALCFVYSDRFCFENESRFGPGTHVISDENHDGDCKYTSRERKWPPCKLWETGVSTWRFAMYG